jgi:hypothetical protein
MLPYVNIICAAVTLAELLADLLVIISQRAASAADATSTLDLRFSDLTLVRGKTCRHDPVAT